MGGGCMFVKNHLTLTTVYRIDILREVCIILTNKSLISLNFSVEIVRGIITDIITEPVKNNVNADNLYLSFFFTEQCKAMTPLIDQELEKIDRWI